MIKERVKSFILVILVIFTLVLAERILVDEKLWPTGYNFFNIGINLRKSEHSISDSLTAPERIIVNTGYQSSRFEYLRTSQEFERISQASGKILKTAFKNPARNISQIPAESWYSALTGKSVYLSYPTTFSANIFSRLLGAGNTEASFKSFSDIVIDENGIVYINDGGTFYKTETSHSEISEIIESILGESREVYSVINYSFDLNFDKEFGSQKTILSPMIPIYSESVKAEVISSHNPIEKDSNKNQRIINQILQAFSVNPNSTWKYTEADGTLVFVENTGILKISPDGVLTFTASDAGIKLSSGVGDAHEIVSSVAEFIDTVNLAIDQKAEMFITSSLDQNDVYLFNFDYTIGGVPVKYSDKNAVSVKTGDGYITEYTHILRNYEPCGYTAESPLYIEALDKIIEKYQDSMNQIDIKKMFPAYIDRFDSERLLPDWHIEIDNIVAE